MTSDTGASAAAQARLLRYWDQRAPEYDVAQRRRLEHPDVRAAWRDVWCGALPAVPATILDVGTGTGHVALQLAALGYEVTGVDLSRGMLAQARLHAAGLDRAPRFVVGDAHAPPMPPGGVDAVTACYVLWTLPDPERALRAWSVAMRPGGVLVVVDSAWYPDGVGAAYRPGRYGSTNPEFRQYYDDDVVRALPLAEADSIARTADAVRDAGFVDVAVTPLDRVRRVDERHGVPDGHRVQTKYAVTARLSAGVLPSGDGHLPGT